MATLRVRTVVCGEHVVTVDPTAKAFAVGGHGGVFDGVLDDGIPVAVKLVDVGDPHAEAEVVAVTALEAAGVTSGGCNVVRTFPVGRVGHYFVLPMRRYQGDLFSVLEKVGPFSPRTAAKAMAQLIRGVLACHRRHVYHLDIKPENVLFVSNADGVATLALTDFGNAAVCGGCTMKPGGTTAYAAPETLAPVVPYDAAKADAWSLGVTLFAMVTVGLPWSRAAADEPSYAAWTAGEDVLSPTGGSLPVEVEILLRRLLDPDPATRMGVRDLARDPWLTQQPARRRPRTPPAPGPCAAKLTPGNSGAAASPAVEHPAARAPADRRPGRPCVLIPRHHPEVFQDKVDSGSPRTPRCH